MSHRVRRRRWWWRIGLAVLLAGALVDSPTPARGLEGQFVRVDQPSTHEPGKVKIVEFADFFCPHCHMFERTAIPMLKEEFGDRIEVDMVGYPVIPGMLPTPFVMYEQAKRMGKGPEMKAALFRTIHQDRVVLFDRTVRAALAREVGVDVEAFEAGLASGRPAKAFTEGRRWGERIEVSSTPTVLLDGNIKIEGEHLSPENLETVIRSILATDAG